MVKVLLIIIGIIAIPLILGAFLFPAVWRDSKSCLDNYNKALEENISQIKSNAVLKEEACINSRNITENYFRCVNEFMAKNRIPKGLVSVFTLNKPDGLKKFQNEICRNYPSAIIP